MVDSEMDKTKRAIINRKYYLNRLKRKEDLENTGAVVLYIDEHHSSMRMSHRTNMLKGNRGTLIRKQYSEFLQGYYWDDFITTTFRSPRKEPFYALKQVEAELLKHNVSMGFLACEPFQSGDLHIHGIVAGMPPGWKPEIDLPWDIWSGLFERFGRSKVEMCNSQESVTAYCSKYVLKQQSRVCDYYSLFGEPMNWEGRRIN